MLDDSEKQGESSPRLAPEWQARCYNIAPFNAKRFWLLYPYRTAINAIASVLAVITGYPATVSVVPNNTCAPAIVLVYAPVCYSTLLLQTTL